MGPPFWLVYTPPVQCLLRPVGTFMQSLANCSPSVSLSSAHCESGPNVTEPPPLRVPRKTTKS